VHDDVGAHLDQRVGEAHAVLVHGLVHHGTAVRLSQGDDERLLPVRHEAGVHVGLDHDGLDLAVATEQDAVFLDVETSRRPCGRC
jgi:hypothetical protein